MIEVKEITVKADLIIKSIFGENAIFENEQYEVIRKSFLNQGKLTYEQETEWGDYLTCVSSTNGANKTTIVICLDINENDKKMVIKQKEIAEKLGLNVVQIYSKKIQKDRDEIINKIEKGVYDIVFISYSIFYNENNKKIRKLGETSNILQVIVLTDLRKRFLNLKEKLASESVTQEGVNQIIKGSGEINNPFVYNYRSKHDETFETFLTVRLFEEKFRIKIICKSLQGYDNCVSLCQKLDIIRLCSSTKTMEKLNPVELEHFSTQKQVFDFRVRRGVRLQLDSERPFVIFTSTPDQMARLTDEKIEATLKEVNKFDIVIVDEASQMDVGHFLPALLRVFVKDGSHTKFIIAGDDKQLQPVRKEEVKGTDEALFGSVYNYFKKYKDADGKLVFSPTPLSISRRSNHCIIDFIREAFAYDKSFASSADKADALVSYQNELDVSSMLFAETLKPETGLALLVYDDGLSSQRNEFEIEQICNYVKIIWECGLADVGDVLTKFFASGVGIVVPHTAQRAGIRKRLFDTFRAMLPPEKYDDQIIRDATFGAVDTVERFQGQERDIILAGYVVGNKDAITNEEEFIYDRCRMNVIISRAKYKAIVMASRELMDNISNDIEIIELQKAFQKLKDYCNSKTFMIQEAEWKEKRGQAYLKYV